MGQEGMTPEVAKKFKYWQTRTIIASMIGYALFYFVRKNLSIAMPAMQEDLGITKGDKENSYIVHFSDSAMVSRAVARGYVTVNGKEVELTEDTKQQLLKTDKEASAAREKAYQDWLIVSRNSILP